MEGRRVGLLVTHFESNLSPKCQDVIGALLASEHVVDLVIGAMELGILGINASAVGTPAHPELATHTSWSHGTEGLQLAFDLGDPGFPGLNRGLGGHV